MPDLDTPPQIVKSSIEDSLRQDAAAGTMLPGGASKWPAERIGELIRLAKIEPPLSVAEMARRLAVTKDALRNKRSRLGIVQRPLPEPRQDTWTPERVERLVALWEEGVPTAEIGRRLGLTKNAIIGKLHRLGLGGSKWQPYEPPQDVFNGGGCLWPIGDPGAPGFHFCGAHDLVARKPYCALHAAIAYERPAEEEAPRAMTPSQK